jgi:hypothetical protein
MNEAGRATRSWSWIVKPLLYGLLLALGWLHQVLSSVFLLLLGVRLVMAPGALPPMFALVATIALIFLAATSWWAVFATFGRNRWHAIVVLVATVAGATAGAGLLVWMLIDGPPVRSWEDALGVAIIASFLVLMPLAFFPTVCLRLDRLPIRDLRRARRSGDTAALDNALASPRAEVRWHAARWLADIGPPAASSLPQLEALRRDANRHVRSAAELAAKSMSAEPEMFDAPLPQPAAMNPYSSPRW